jgi:RecA/RadA recombinase
LDRAPSEAGDEARLGRKVPSGAAVGIVSAEFDVVVVDAARKLVAEEEEEEAAGDGGTGEVAVLRAKSW